MWGRVASPTHPSLPAGAITRPSLLATTMPIDPVTKRSDLDVLSTTSLARWRDVDFVCGNVSWTIEQQHAVHTYPDRDAGYVESTGRNPAVFTFTAIFRRGVVGPGGGRAAFPEDFRRFQAACADRTAGQLVHPLLGTLKVKCQRASVQIDPSRRDGADVEVSFIEATDREDELAALLGQQSTIGSAYDAARSFDGAYGALQPEPPPLEDSLKPSLLDSLKQVTGALAQARLSVGNAIAKIDGMASAVSDLTDQVVALDNPKNYPAIAALEKLYGALARMSQEAQRRARPVRPVTLGRAMSLAECSATYGTPVTDLCRLNPLLASRTVLPAGSTVFVFV